MFKKLIKKLKRYLGITPIVGWIVDFPELKIWEALLSGKMTVEEYRNVKIPKQTRTPIYEDEE